MQTTTNDLVERSKNGEADEEDAIQSIDAMITRVENLKRKVGETMNILSQCKGLKLPAFRFERKCWYTHSGGDERTSRTPLGCGRCRKPNHPGVPAVVRYEIRQVAH